MLIPVRLQFTLINDVQYAPKLRGEGRLAYQLWQDQYRSLYVQILRNNEQSNTEQLVTFSCLLFPVADYWLQKNTPISFPYGVCLETKLVKNSIDNNDGVSLRAILLTFTDIMVAKYTPYCISRYF
ncbi:hypothetical protein C0W54_07455 [Photobacterium kishitanii]|uniref:hypothetical protein n=1 Tax=Photobacterium kishitanii TaxID=318456 RepID=UPI000D17E183|nr:hypothetical protein [Photobacterium kishitanii]PSW62159.1 hypothetical protein C0W54_07455 [Photobacterium kishitanii]